ncbi:MFS transporter [Flexivirga oryzae]|uniref:DHA1 family inner membrane transport protein n=1 Tax=Flexivirga oryzae TaxID=1794944 RepID=A0A839N731_9MICO|nr:DHA1 family inner membrane transport protein [Flexivirga oryzae]
MSETPTAAPAHDTTGVALPASRTRLALIALALGGFAIGTTEFVTMGLLPQIADGVHISIPVAGHVVSAYALGVVVGAPLVATIAARRPRKTVLLWLMVAFAVGNLASALAPNYPALMVARFVSGLPHGAFFGIGSVVAASLVPWHRRTSAVAMMLAGLTVANVVGVPVATLLGQRLGWQWPYVLVTLVALVTLLAVLVWVPGRRVDDASSARSELSALRRPQVWLTLGVGTVGFGGMFATFSYITPTMTHLAGFADGAVPLILVVYGVGMTVGTMLSGRVAAHGMLRGMTAALAAIAVLLAVFGELAQLKATAVIGVFLLGMLPSVLVPLLQTRLMDVAREGQSLAAALNHSTLNIANALGAWLGSVVLSHGLGYEWPSRIGALLAVGGIGIAAASAVLARREAVAGA